MNAQANAALDLDIDMKVNLAYKITNGQLIFPPNKQFPSGGGFAPADARKFFFPPPIIIGVLYEVLFD